MMKMTIGQYRRPRLHVGSGLGFGMLSGGRDVSAERWMACRDKQWNMEVCERPFRVRDGKAWTLLGEAQRG